MSVPRSIDRADIGAANINCPSGIQTVAISGPSLQTPKDTSIVCAWGTVYFTAASGVSYVDVFMHSGAGGTGPQVGQDFRQGVPAGGGPLMVPFCFTTPSNFTDYLQLSLTLAPTGGALTVFAGCMVVISF